MITTRLQFYHRLALRRALSFSLVAAAVSALGSSFNYAVLASATDRTVCLEAGQDARRASKKIKWHKNLDATKQLAKQEGKLLLVEVYADWCGWCTKMDKVTYANSDVIAHLNERFVCVRMDVETRQGQQFAQQFDIQGLPCAVVIDPVTGRSQKIPGYLPAGVFIAALDGAENVVIGASQDQSGSDV
ncbi:MAG TPA: thioredoxin family protein [Candidatus Obscuribacterales bacterium]